MSPEKYRQLKTLVNTLAECGVTGVSQEKYRQLETIFDALAESSPSPDYMNSTKEMSKDAQEVRASIQDINTKNAAFERKNNKLQTFLNKVKKRKRPKY